MPPRNSSVHPTIVDAASLFDACDFFAGRSGKGRISVNYAELKSVLDQYRLDQGWPASTINNALLSIDPESEGQQRFNTMLDRAGFEPDAVYFRDNFVSLPPGRTPNNSDEGHIVKPIVSMASRITYIAGLLAHRLDTHLLVVSHGFELYGPLLDLSHRLTKGKVGLAYFGSLLDYRWKAAGLFEPGFELSFCDLDQYAPDLLGIDLSHRAGASGDARAGLSRF